MNKSLDWSLFEEYVGRINDLWETEAWQKVNHHDKTNGLSQKAVNSYRREHPGSKLQTAVTTKPSKLKKGSKAAKRRKSFCARMSGNKGPMKKPNGKPTPKALALRRWNCESIEQMAQMIAKGEQLIAEIKKGQKDSNGFTKCWPGKHAEGTKKGKNGKPVRNCVPNESQGVAEGSNNIEVGDKITWWYNKFHPNYEGIVKQLQGPYIIVYAPESGQMYQLTKDDIRSHKKKGVAEGEGNLSKALDTLSGSWSGWHQVDSYEPDIEKYEWDDGEGGYYAGGSIEHNLQTGEITVDFADEYNDEIKGTFKNIGDAMRALRGGYPGSHGGKAPNFDRLGQRTPPGPDDLRKTDRTGRKGTIGGGYANQLKGSIQANKGRLGPKGVLPEQGMAEGHADQQRKIFKKNGHPVGEVGIDRESSPGNGQWYMKYYATGDDFGGYDSMEEAVADLKHLVNQFKAEGVAEGSLNEFAPDGFNGGDDDEGFSPEIAKMAQEDGFTKGAGLADGATLERAITINHWHSQHGGMYKQYFAKGFKAGRMNKIRHNNKQYNLNLKLMKDGSIRHGEQGVAEGSLEEKWTQKYKNSINCSNPKGFSQKAHCAGKNK